MNALAIAHALVLPAAWAATLALAAWAAKEHRRIRRTYAEKTAAAVSGIGPARRPPMPKGPLPATYSLDRNRQEGKR